jgi:hypothetical protein
MVSKMEDKWKSNDDSIYFIDMDTENLMLVLELDDETITVSLARPDVETLVEFLAEWAGFPVYLNDSDFDANTSYGEY